MLATVKPNESVPVLAKILVIDDNPIIQRTVYFALRDRGYKVFMSGEISDALNIVRMEKPDLILLDINFPPDGSVGGVRDGFWALDWMQRMNELRGVPIAMISGDAPEKSEARARAGGAAAYIHKPLDREALAEVVAALLAQKKSATEKSGK